MSENLPTPDIYTHSVMNLGISACKCTLDSVFLIEKDVGTRATQGQIAEEKPKIEV